MTSVAWELSDGVVHVVGDGERAGVEHWGLEPSPARLPDESDACDWDFADSMAASAQL